PWPCTTAITSEHSILRGARELTGMAVQDQGLRAEPERVVTGVVYAIKSGERTLAQASAHRATREGGLAALSEYSFSEIVLLVVVQVHLLDATGVDRCLPGECEACADGRVRR